MSTGDTAASSDMEQSLSALRQAREQAAAEVETMADAQERYEAVTQVTEELRSATYAWGEWRGQILMEIWEDEKLSLGTLAKKVGISKSRADQLIRAARKEGE